MDEELILTLEDGSVYLPQIIENEKIRVANENTRISNEAERKDNEEIRKANELERQANEKERTKTMDSLVSNFNELKTDTEKELDTLKTNTETTLNTLTTNTTNTLNTLTENTEKEIDQILAEKVNYYKKYENTYTTTTADETDIDIGIDEYNSATLLFVDINGLTLIDKTDYSIDSENRKITLTQAVDIGTPIHFICLKTAEVSSSDYSLLQGEKGDTGEQGIQGEKGDKGDTGDTGTTFTPSVSETGDLSWSNDGGKENPATVNIKGSQGVQGQSATISIGTVTTVDTSVSASVVNSGTSSEAVFDFSIPKGEQGIQGEKGDKGEQGEQGIQGEKGDTGIAATIEIGTTTTGEAGTSAIVTNTGTENSAIFNFTIPKGEKGDTGAQGEQGEQGIQGEKGDSGINVNVGLLGTISTTGTSIADGSGFEGLKTLAQAYNDNTLDKYDFYATASGGLTKITTLRKSDDNFILSMLSLDETYESGVSIKTTYTINIDLESEIAKLISSKHPKYSYYTNLDSKPQINNVELTDNKTTSDLNISYNDLIDKPQINGIELADNKTTSDLSVSYNDLADKPIINYYISEDLEAGFTEDDTTEIAFFQNLFDDWYNSTDDDYNCLYRVKIYMYSSETDDYIEASIEDIVSAKKHKLHIKIPIEITANSGATDMKRVKISKSIQEIVIYTDRTATVTSVDALTETNEPLVGLPVLSTEDTLETTIGIYTPTLPNQPANKNYVDSSIASIGTYSTEEINTGEIWTDGGTIYKKVVEITALNSDNLYEHGISNLSEIVAASGMAYFSSGTGSGWQPVQRGITDSIDNTYGLSFGDIASESNPTKFSFQVGTAYTNFSRAHFIFKYTKTE